MLYDSFHGKCAGDFAVCFTAHAVGKDEQVERLHEPEAVFIIRANTAHIGRAATENSHKHTPGWRPGRTHPFRAILESKLTDQGKARKAMRPTDYSRIDYKQAGLAILLALRELSHPAPKEK